jgi:fatty-acid desaturase
MHRLFIHRSFKCSQPLEVVLVHLGTIMGIAGPLGMAKAHDFRDWAQRQQSCHPYFSQHSSFWRDTWYQLHCDVALRHSPAFVPSPDMQRPWVQWMERTWRWQQLPWALGLYLAGGPLYVVWGVFGRVCVSTYGHFFVGWFAHNEGPLGSQNYRVRGVAVQGYNVGGWPIIGRNRVGAALQAVLCAGENYHANHHAFPGSAKLSVADGEFDLGFAVLKGMEAVGLVSDIRVWQDLPPRAELEKA